MQSQPSNGLALILSSIRSKAEGNASSLLPTLPSSRIEMQIGVLYGNGRRSLPSTIGYNTFYSTMTDALQDITASAMLYSTFGCASLVALVRGGSLIRLLDLYDTSTFLLAIFVRVCKVVSRTIHS